MNDILWRPLGEHMTMDWVHPLLPEPMSRTSFAFAWVVANYGDEVNDG